MKKRIGELIKLKLDSSGMDVTSFAKKLGKDRSTVYDIFLRDSIDTKLLEKIGQILEYDFFQEFLFPKTKREILLKESISNSIFIEVKLNDEEIENFKIKEKVIKYLNKKTDDE